MKMKLKILEKENFKNLKFGYLGDKFEMSDEYILEFNKDDFLLYHFYGIGKIFFHSSTMNINFDSGIIKKNLDILDKNYLDEFYK